jgi:hypothetical protein
LRLTTEPKGAIGPGQIATYQLVAHNSGRGAADALRGSLPFAPEAQTLLDATFTSPSAWVSTILSNAVELRLGALKSGQTVTATLRLRTSQDAAMGRELTTRARFQWNSRGGSSAGVSNPTQFIIGQDSARSAIAPLGVTPSAGPPSTAFAVVYDGFASGERVSLWYHGPDGKATGLNELQANMEGRITYTLSIPALRAGQYQIRAFGQCSQVSAAGIFTITEELTVVEW